jgi:hypothetical protein
MRKETGPDPEPDPDAMRAATCFTKVRSLSS